MHIFKLTPTPQRDFRLEVNGIQKNCKIEKHGYRHNKIVYGFCEDMPDIAALQALGLTIEASAADETQLSLMNDLVERGHAKSKLDHLKREQEESGKNNEQEQAIAEKRLTDISNNIQTAKETLSITGTLKVLKF